MLRHSHAQNFIETAKIELKALEKKPTWSEVDLIQAIKAGKKLISTTWVYKYKFDEHGYLAKYRTCLCARENLQHTDQDTFAAKLAFRIFRALMALVAAFDLETRQYDAVNAFSNSPINEPTYCKPPEG